MKKFFLTLLGILVISSFGIIPGETNAADSGAGNSVTTSYDTYTYEYVWIDGVRWVYVYTADGNLIDMYPDSE